MSDLQAYGYVEHQPCECLDCGCEIQAGWRCLKCAKEALATLPAPVPYVNRYIDQGQFYAACEAINRVIGAGTGGVGGWAVE